MPSQREIEMRQILRERDRQSYEKGYTGDHDSLHTPGDWLAIIVHECGCLADLLLKENCRARDDAVGRATVKIGAVALASLEHVCGLANEKDECKEE